MSGAAQAFQFYEGLSACRLELPHFSRLSEPGFASLPESEIRSTGYVVDTLEAVLWCLLNTDSYRDCLLKAVNPGDDTDTTAVAGLLYGPDAIPQNRMKTLARREYTEERCEKRCFGPE